MIIVVALSLAAVLYMLMPAAGADSDGGWGDNPIKKNPNLPKTNQTTTRLTETPKQDESYYDDVYFIGDSRTVALSAYGVPEDHIFAEDGLNHENAMNKQVVRLASNKLVSIPEAVRITAPDIMIVNFGINGASWMPVDSFMESYEAFVDALIEASPHSVLVLEAILPVTLSYEQQADGCTNEKIDELNDRIYDLAKEKGLFYLGTNDVMKNDENDLDMAYHGNGGIHYNAAGYEVITNYILTHAVLKE